MSIRAKCAILLIAFEATLAVTILLAIHYTKVYLEDAAESFSASRAMVEDVGRLAALVREESSILPDLRAGDADDATRRNRRIDARAAVLVATLSDRITAQSRSDLLAALEARQQAADAHIAATRADAGTPPPFSSTAHRNLGVLLEDLETHASGEVRRAVDRTVETQQTIAVILSINMVVGSALGIAGIWLVRRWALIPLRSLTHATDEMGKGNLDHRAPVTSRDELGKLAAALNKMAADLAQSERIIIQRERLAAMGEMASYVAHNIRNPLAGIQSSAELTRQEAEPGSSIAEHQASIIAAIARFQRWLRQIEHSYGPLDIDIESTDLQMLVDGVVSVFRPLADRTAVAIEQTRMPAGSLVNIDGRQFEQALTAVIGNAVEAVDRGGHVSICFDEPAAGDAPRWTLSVTDDGPGIPAEVRGRIFEPTFTTKQHGQGLGLSMAKKVVDLHGGEVTCECPPAGGTIIRFIMPAEPGERPAHA